MEANTRMLHAPVSVKCPKTEFLFRNVTSSSKIGKSVFKLMMQGALKLQGLRDHGNGPL